MNVKRDSNIELLRIITMFLIVLYHLCRHGFSEYLYDYSFSFNNLFIKTVSHMGGFSNCVFLMISGYYLVDARFSWKKVVKLIFQCFFVSLFIGTLLFIFKIPSVISEINIGEELIARPLTFSEYKRYLQPFKYSLNWFTTIYLPFYLFSPFLVTIVKNIT